ncbi:MAG TPA: cupin domain-containing protein [Anaerolineae bacterium]|nr:cupin domain-containing protein [Anaerolineae bacterium]
MEIQAINLTDKLALFDEHWSPRIIAQMNDYHFKLAKIQGEFIWHSHPETDEVFIILKGEMRIEFRDYHTELSEGEMCVVPRGIEHKPVAENECQIMLVEPVGTVNTGDAGGERTKTEVIWI